LAELQLRLPYTAWGDGDEWEEGHEEILDDLYEGVEEAGLGQTDDPDHFDDFICFYLLGDDLDVLRQAAHEVLARHDLLSAVTAMVTDPDAGDMDQGTPVSL
jgi:hypothetical protein